MARKKSNVSEFRVVLQGLKLPREVERRIEVEIRKAVMREVASIDMKGDLQILPRSKFPSSFETHDEPGVSGVYIIGSEGHE